MLTGFERFNLVNALAQSSAPDYKALVSIFLFGGNDGNNMIVPLDAGAYQSYAAVRGALAHPQSSLLSVNTPNNAASYGLHPGMPELQTLWANGKLAALANVGTLVEPVTRQQYLAAPAKRPDDLFSHSDQQEQWQTSIAKKTGMSPTGWGGRTADRTHALYGGGSFPMIISTAGATLFTVGDESRALVPSSGLRGFDSSASSTTRYNAMRQLLTTDTDALLVQSASDTTVRAIDNTALLNTALASAPALTTVFPNTGLGNQLKQVAQIISSRSSLGLRRQIFFCSLGGFDTHNNQLPTQASLLPQLSKAMKAFYDATVELGVAAQVTTFTLSDFGRTLKPAAGAGTDHAWGNHHFVMGDAVRGGNLYGKFPTFALGGADDSGNEGRWIPTTAVDQYAATLASWYGLPASDLTTVFPNIGRFASSSLGFLI